MSFVSINYKPKMIRIWPHAAIPLTVSHLEDRMKGPETCTPVWGLWPRWGWEQVGPRGISSWDKDDIPTFGARGNGRWRPVCWTRGARRGLTRAPEPLWSRARAPGPGPWEFRSDEMWREWEGVGYLVYLHIYKVYVKAVYNKCYKTYYSSRTIQLEFRFN